MEPHLAAAGCFPFKPDALQLVAHLEEGAAAAGCSEAASRRLGFAPPAPSSLTMEFFLGNPFSTAVGQRIERATSSSLQSEDWDLNLEICESINSSEEGPRDAIRAIKKRIVGNKNFKEVMLALTVLETCVKNCGNRFHILVTTRDFIEGVLVRSIIPSNNPPLIVHDRVLGIIQAWADAFRSSPDLTGVVSVYEDLRRKGLEFPVTPLEGYTPVQGTKKTLSGNGPAVTALPAARLSSQTPQTSVLTLALDGTNAFTPSQVQRLKTDLGVVRSNLSTMSDMMSQLDPITVKQADMELLELYTVCKEMQGRIVKIIPKLNEEKLIEELLATNDEMNTAFTRYHRFEKRITNGQGSDLQSHTYINLTDPDVASESFSRSGIASVKSDSSLSLSKPDSLSSQMAKLSTSESDDTLSPKTEVLTQSRAGNRSEDTADGLARAQDSSLQISGMDDSPASTRSSSPKLEWMIKRGMIPLNQSSVMDDIEKWLSLEEEQFDDFEESDGVTSEEFDKFLAERAKAAERLPSLRAPSQESPYSES
ncbi:target of Myb protein 1 isoform X2 [Oryzias melastigma]|uniref:target of Myb protein 1 isoform X2 n=1 Tax=Oryzias melastigma TaxID=30732 RepID=UPI000CF81E9F|nr:target of Myb protein 1 isoform X2 [Oryzias melastigma]